MVTIRSVNEIILNLIDFFKIAQPDLDTKPGTVARDLAIDGPANVAALIYDELSKVSTQQSLRLVVGSDLDKLAKNFGLYRKQATPSNGVGLLTFASIPATIAITQGGLVTANNGFSFAVVNGLSVVPSQLNFYKSIATQYANNLAFVGISDPYAVQISLQATTPGSSGNIANYSLNSTSIAGVSNVTNVTPFIGGNDQESDASFRNRILSVFSGSSVGTALGYKNVALAVTGVADAYIVEPGDPLMTRDGSVVTSDAQGNLTIVSEGTGGKVDVVILGSTLVQNTDSFIYHDLSNTNDPTNVKNNYVIGQIAADANKTFNQKRISDLANNTIPSQPVENLITVIGSQSGSNFQPMTTNALGVVSGNYELLKDTSVYAGSLWGFDALHWINNQITYNEDLIKGQFNGQDAVTFSDVLIIPQVTQNISITNENSQVLASNNTLIQLLHTPATAVTRVFNVNTGEKYTIANQNPNGTGPINTSGVIQISGNTLPSQSNVLQVDYSWVITYDQYSDYDGKSLTNNPRAVTDSVDWGYSNAIRNESINFTRNSSNTFFVGNATLPITSVVSSSTFTEIDGYVTTISSGTFTGRYAFVTSNLMATTNTVDHVYLKNTTVELYNTAQGNGIFSTASVVVGVAIEYVTTIILPTDTLAQPGDVITAILNTTDTYNITASTGSFNGNQITIPTANITTTANNILLNTAYIANVQNIISTGITTVPFSRLGNGFVLNSSNGFNNTYPSNITRRENQLVQLNTSNQLFVELSLSNLFSTLVVGQIISVVRLSDGLELWNKDNPGTIIVNSVDNNYQLIFSGYNTPNTGDRVLIIYAATDTQRFQEFTFYNRIYERDFATLQFNQANNTFSLPIHTFVSENPVKYQIMDPNSDIIWASGSDGYLVAGSNPINGTLSSSVNFGNILNSSGQIINILSKKIRILNPVHRNNANTYDITGYNSTTNTLTIGNDFSQIYNRQVSIVRVLDGKEQWSSTGVINTQANTLTFPSTPNANPGDLVFVSFFRTANLRQSATRLAVNITDQIVNTGTLSVIGTTITKAQNIVFATAATTLRQNLLGAIRTALGLNSNVSIPTNVQLVKIAKLERVTTTNANSNDVLRSVATYDTFETTINNDIFFSNLVNSNPALGNFDFILPNTTNNVTNLSGQVSSGDKFRVTFYYATTNDQENVIFSRNGTLYTNKYFATMDRVFISSGFGVSQSAKLTISNFNQPITGSRYTTYYNYLAPQPNERIVITYNTNSLVANTQVSIEANRPINADVLVREAKEILVDVTMNVVITPTMISSTALVLQNLQDQLIATINSNGLGAYIDSSSLINAAFSVSGVGGARIQSFNVDGVAGSVVSLQAHNDQYFVANVITVNAVAN